MAFQESPTVIIKEECDLEYETLHSVRELQAVREKEIANDIMDEIFGTQSSHFGRNDSEPYVHQYADEGATLVIIKEEIDCDTLEHLEFQLDSIYSADKDPDGLEDFGLEVNSMNLNEKEYKLTPLKNLPPDQYESIDSGNSPMPASTLRRSTRKRCQRVTLADLEAEFLTVPMETTSSRNSSLTAKPRLCKSCKTSGLPTLTASIEDIDDPGKCVSNRTVQASSGSRGQTKCINCGNVIRRGRPPLSKSDSPSTHAPPAGHTSSYGLSSPYMCRICDRSFATYQYLRRHQTIHSMERPFKCSICTLTFKRSDNLQQHKLLHSGKREYVCDTCGRDFTQRSQMRKHMKTHMQMHMQTHKQTHSTVRPYTCDVCGKSYRTRETMVTHTRTHTGEKPFKCDLCGRAFGQRAHLREHRRIHTGDRPFECGVCCKRFYRATHLRQHSCGRRKKKKAVK